MEKRKKGFGLGWKRKKKSEERKLHRCMRENEAEEVTSREGKGTSDV